METGCRGINTCTRCDRLHELAAERPRFGYRRLHILLRREGYRINHKRVYRLYRAAGIPPLTVP